MTSTAVLGCGPTLLHCQQRPTSTHDQKLPSCTKDAPAADTRHGCRVTGRCAELEGALAEAQHRLDEQGRALESRDTLVSDAAARAESLQAQLRQEQAKLAQLQADRAARIAALEVRPAATAGWCCCQRNMLLRLTQTQSFQSTCSVLWAQPCSPLGLACTCRA